MLGERLPPPTALSLGVVDHTAPLEDVTTRALEIATALAGKARPVLSTIRADYYGEAIALLKGVAPAG